MPPGRSLFPLLLLFGACAPAGEMGSGPGAGGKADGVRECSEKDSCLEFERFEVLFTNPLCERYEYPEPMPTAGQALACDADCAGDADVEACRQACLEAVVAADEAVAAKPENVYCHQATDLGPSGERPHSPQFRLAEWIASTGDGDSIFLAFLSFSDRLLADELCEAAERGVEIDFVIDRMSSRAEQLAECGGRVHVRGSRTRFAHVKLVMVNPDGAGPADAGADTLRLAFGSGNMSTGTTLHHENWQFLEVARDSYFVEAHRCLAAGLIDEEASSRKDNFRRFINDCRAEIPFEEESDIKAYFIPVNDDSDAVIEAMLAAVRAAGSVDVAAHRFSFFQSDPEKRETEPRLIDTLGQRLADDPEFTARLIADDDLYWLRPLTGDRGFKLGPNSDFELDSLDHLTEAGGDRFEVRYLETNHTSKGCTGSGGTFSSPLLQHNKFLILRDMEDRGDAILTGAPNLTVAGFTNNFENVYMIAIPEVVEAYQNQYIRFWDGQRILPDEPEPPRATPVEEMPMVIQTVNPPDLEDVCAAD